VFEGGTRVESLIKFKLADILDTNGKHLIAA